MFGIQTADAKPLPWFCSDRFDLFRSGTNDVPWTFQHLPTLTDEWTFSNGIGATISIEPWVGDPSVYTVAGYFEWVVGEEFWSDEPFVLSGPGAFNPLVYPFAFYLVNGLTMGYESFQVEWIEPSFQWCLDHVWAGFCVAIPADLLVFILSGVIAPVRQVLRAL